MEVEAAPGHWLDDEGAVGSLVGQPDASRIPMEEVGDAWRDAHGTDVPAADSWI